MYIRRSETCYDYPELKIMAETTTTLFKHNFGHANQASLTEYQGKRRLNLRVLDGSYPARKYLSLSARDVKHLQQLIPQVTQILTDGQENFFEINEHIRLSVTRGCVDIRLRWTPPNQSEKVFTRRGIFMKQYEFDQLADLLNEYSIYFL